MQIKERDKLIFDQMSDKQFNCIMDFANKYIEHLDSEIQNLEVDLKLEDYDKM